MLSETICRCRIRSTSVISAVRTMLEITDTKNRAVSDRSFPAKRFLFSTIFIEE